MATISKEDLNEFVEDTDQANYQLNLIKSKIKIKPNKGFIMVFDQNLLKIINEFNLNATDIKVLLKVCDYVSYGNLISLTHLTIADDLDIKRQQVSRSFNKLEKAKIFYKTKTSLFLNPNYMVKGELRKSKEGEAYKSIRNNLYKELSQYITDKDELEKKVYETMAF
jgi:predicted transcriptional regulator